MLLLQLCREQLLADSNNNENNNNNNNKNNNNNNIKNNNLYLCYCCSCAESSCRLTAKMDAHTHLPILQYPSFIHLFIFFFFFLFGHKDTLAHTAIPVIYFHQFYNCEIYFLATKTHLPILQSPSFIHSLFILNDFFWSCKHTCPYCNPHIFVMKLVLF